MDDKELADALREIFTAVNEEARLAGPATLQRCMDSVFDGPGVDWLLSSAEAWKLVDMGKLRQDAGPCRDLLRSETGKAELKRQLTQRWQEIEKWRRQIVAHTRVWQTKRTPLEFECQGSVDAGEVYSILTQNAKREGDVSDEDGLHDHQSQC